MRNRRTNGAGGSSRLLISKHHCYPEHPLGPSCSEGETEIDRVKCGDSEKDRRDLHHCSAAAADRLVCRSVSPRPIGVDPGICSRTSIPPTPPSSTPSLLKYFHPA